MYKELEKQFENAVELIKLDSDYSDCFDRIKFYGNAMRKKELDTPYEINAALMELGGLFESINPIAATADTYLTNLEENVKGKKRVSKALKTIESFEEEEVRLAIYRKIRNKFVERRNSCDKMITILQSALKNWQKEWNINK